MSVVIDEDLAQLASEFTIARQSGKGNQYPLSIWYKAIILAKKLTIPVVCKAINVNPVYFRKKISVLDSINSEAPHSFLEIPQNKFDAINVITINFETPCGNKLKIEGATTSCLVPIVNEFLRRGVSCCK